MYTQGPVVVAASRAITTRVFLRRRLPNITALIISAPAHFLVIAANYSLTPSLPPIIKTSSSKCVHNTHSLYLHIRVEESAAAPRESIKSLAPRRRELMSRNFALTRPRRFDRAALCLPRRAAARPPRAANGSWARGRGASATPGGERVSGAQGWRERGR